MLNNLNSILIEGYIVRDPQLRHTPKGTAVCTFTMATNRYFRKDDGYEKEVSFFDVETWAYLAETCYRLGKKRRGIRAVGRLKQNRWIGADGKPHARISIVAEHVEFRSEFIETAKVSDEELIEQDALLIEEMTDESAAVDVTEAVA